MECLRTRRSLHDLRCPAGLKPSRAAVAIHPAGRYGFQGPRGGLRYVSWFACLTSTRSPGGIGLVTMGTAPSGAWAKLNAFVNG